MPNIFANPRPISTAARAIRRLGKSAPTPTRAEPRRTCDVVLSPCLRWLSPCLHWLSPCLNKLIFLRPAHGGNRKNPRQFTIGFRARSDENHKGGGNESETKFPQTCPIYRGTRALRLARFPLPKKNANMRADAKSHICRENLKPGRSFTIDPQEKCQPVPMPSAPLRLHGSIGILAGTNGYIGNLAKLQRDLPPRRLRARDPQSAQPSWGTREKQRFSFHEAQPSWGHLETRRVSKEAQRKTHHQLRRSLAHAAGFHKHAQPFLAPAPRLLIPSPAQPPRANACGSPADP
jgi:hypothetical protein